MIALPAEGAGLHVVASVSGGKDSTALILALREAGIAARYVFADTGWESAETYAYLDYLRAQLGIVIDVVSARIRSSIKLAIGGAALAHSITAWVSGDVDFENPYSVGSDQQGEFAVDRDGTTYRGGMVDRIRYAAGFPGRMQRWCTRELKIEPLRAYHDALIESTDIETVSAMGIRADESESRAKMPEWEDEPTGQHSWGGWIWRPLLHWTVADVLAIHNRHGVKVNPLYQRGHNRVGCYPCIFASKEEVRLVAEHSPERIDEIRQLEAEMSALRVERNTVEPGRYKHKDAQFFQVAHSRALPVGIDAVVAWSRTERGGKQFSLLAPAPTGGCMRWGICDTPSGGDQ